MRIIGCDFHPGYQQIVFMDQATGEVREQKLSHANQEEVRRSMPRYRSGARGY